MARSTVKSGLSTLRQLSGRVCQVRARAIAEARLVSGVRACAEPKPDPLINALYSHSVGAAGCCRRCRRRGGRHEVV